MIIPLIKGNRWALLITNGQKPGPGFGRSSEHPGFCRDNVTSGFCFAALVFHFGLFLACAWPAVQTSARSDLLALHQERRG